MPNYIIKVKDPDSDTMLYAEWSTIVDCPVSEFMPKDVFLEFYRHEHGEYGYLYELPERMERVEATGCSAMSATGDTVDGLFEANRGGKGEQRMHREALIRKFRFSWNANPEYQETEADYNPYPPPEREYEKAGGMTWRSLFSAIPEDHLDHPLRYMNKTSGDDYPVLALRVEYAYDQESGEEGYDPERIIFLADPKKVGTTVREVLALVPLDQYDQNVCYYNQAYDTVYVLEAWLWDEVYEDGVPEGAFAHQVFLAADER